MMSFEAFRENLIQQMAELLDIPVVGLSTHEIWLALHESHPEAARVTSEQWLKEDLLEEHLFNLEQERTLNEQNSGH
jgi:hypothetical protein